MFGVEIWIVWGCYWGGLELVRGGGGGGGGVDGEGNWDEEIE